MDLDLPTWERSKESLRHYQQRSPEQSPLYRLVYHYKEEFQYRYEEVFQQQYGFLREEVLESFDAFLNCGVLAHGCALACCQSCSHSELIAFSCKKRVICPSCNAKRAHIFAEHLHHNVLLPHPHKHAVFTIPVRLRLYFMYDRDLFSKLYQAAWQTWNDYVCSILPGKTAAVMALHTAGDLLNWHPHLHSIVLAGTVDDDGVFHKIEQINAELLEEMFAKKVFRLLLDKGLISEETIDVMKSWQHSGFKVWFGEDIPEDNQKQRLFIARYLAKCPVASNRIEIINNPLAPAVRYYKDAENKDDYIEVSPLEFLAKLSVHIPKTHERTTRLYGLYSYRTRGAKKREQEFKALLENNFEPIELREEVKPVSTYWATWIKKVYEVDPLICKKCGSQMKIKSFIHSTSKIKKICDDLHIPQWRAPPPLERSERYIDTSAEFSQ